MFTPILGLAEVAVIISLPAPLATLIPAFEKSAIVLPVSLPILLKPFVIASLAVSKELGWRN